MPNIYKIGLTDRTVEERLKEANTSSTWSPPYPYEILCFVEVDDTKNKEMLVHKILDSFRIRKDREFFKDVPTEMIKSIFELASPVPKLNLQGIQEQPSVCRRSPRSEIPLENYLKDGQKIRHKTSDNDYLEGIFDLKSKKIICTGGKYANLTDFVRSHEDSRHVDRKGSYLWKECEVLWDGKWTPLQKIE